MMESISFGLLAATCHTRRSQKLTLSNTLSPPLTMDLLAATCHTRRSQDVCKGSRFTVEGERCVVSS